MSRFSVLSAITAFVVLAMLAACNAGVRASVRAQSGPVPGPAVDATLASGKGEQSLVVAGGCFWGIQGVFSRVKGVTNATSGYSGG